MIWGAHPYFWKPPPRFVHIFFLLQQQAGKSDFWECKACWNKKTACRWTGGPPIFGWNNQYQRNKETKQENKKTRKQQNKTRKEENKTAIKQTNKPNQTKPNATKTKQNNHTKSTTNQPQDHQTKSKNPSNQNQNLQKPRIRIIGHLRIFGKDHLSRLRHQAQLRHVHLNDGTWENSFNFETAVPSTKSLREKTKNIWATFKTGWLIGILISWLMK